MKKTDILIIGGGAAGLMAACAAAKAIYNGGVVTVLEGNPKLGRKLLATGNGRCNLTNINVSAEHYHGDVKLLEPLLNVYSVDKVLSVFRDMGLVTRSDAEGRVYPNNLQAAAVLSVLKTYAEEQGVRFVTGSTVSELKKAKGVFHAVCSDGEVYEAAKCILACGGAASPRHSCCVNGYDLAKSMGHSVSVLYPVLTQLTCSNKKIKTVSGTRCAVNASLLADGKPVYKESGEVQFTDTGLSGICVFGLSVYASAFFATGKINGEAAKALSVALDCLPEWSFAEISEYLREVCSRFPMRTAGDLLTGLLNMKLGTAMVQEAGIDLNTPLRKVSAAQQKKLASVIKGWKFDISGTKGWNDAQVTAGGVPLQEADPLTMESRKAKGLYLAGEMLNIHGDCGGYNLHFAWATGHTAGLHAAQKK